MSCLPFVDFKPSLTCDSNAVKDINVLEGYYPLKILLPNMFLENEDLAWKMIFNVCDIHNLLLEFAERRERITMKEAR
jgi:hypothetical protein